MRSIGLTAVCRFRHPTQSTLVLFSGSVGSRKRSVRPCEWFRSFGGKAFESVRDEPKCPVRLSIETIFRLQQYPKVIVDNVGGF